MTPLDTVVYNIPLLTTSLAFFHVCIYPSVPPLQCERERRGRLEGDICTVSYTYPLSNNLALVTIYPSTHPPVCPCSTVREGRKGSPRGRYLYRLLSYTYPLSNHLALALVSMNTSAPPSSTPHLQCEREGRSSLEGDICECSVGAGRRRNR